MPTRTISIAMCTFNGAAWVAQQLQSIAAQTRRPDELIICDDHSSDATADLLHQFAKEAPFPVRVVQNPAQLGVASNFSQSIELCTGDYIALADQDDWWHPRKLARLEEEVARRPDLGFVFSDAQLVDAELQPTGVRLWDTLYLDVQQRQRLTSGRAVRALARTNVVTGATMMFHARHKGLILPVSPHWIHDGWIALLIAAVAPCAMVDEPLLDYRQHPRQQIGARKTTLFQQIQVGLDMDTAYFQREALRWCELYERGCQHATSFLQPSDLQLLKEKASFFQDRYQMRLQPGRRWLSVSKHWSQGHYSKLAFGWKSLLQDLFIRP